MIVAAVVAVLFMIPWTIGRAWRRWVVLGVFFGVCVLYGLVRLFCFKPPPFDITVSQATVDYEFRNEDYAEAFAALNDGDVTSLNYTDEIIADEVDEEVSPPSRGA